uniref:hypothetical protein n=1 Tax=Acetatifactor sp. TaxID=1872090 RepID=UPI004056E14D
MKNTKKFKKLMTLTCIAAFSMAALFSPATTLIAEAATEESTVAPCADAIQWRYKEENGKLYKRLFNYTTGSWVGDWIYVCDL